MKRATNKRVVLWRRPVSFRPSFSWLKRPAKVRLRSRKVYIGLGKQHALLINLRRFRVSAPSNKTRVLNLPLNIAGYKQVTVGLLRLSPAKFAQHGLAFKPARAGATLVIVLGLMGTMWFGNLIINQPVFSPSPAYALPVEINQPVVEQPAGLGHSRPLKIHASAIGLDYPIKSVGLKEDRTMETPGLFEKFVGWFEPGPSPGEVGPAVIVGHVNTYLGPSVFARLHELSPGDKVSIDRKDGETAVFKVQSIQQFNQDDFPTSKVYGPLDYAGLRLITCGGTFNPLTGKYSHNTVVFAKLVE